MGATQVPTAAKVRELERELALRRTYYVHAVANGNLKQQEADYRIEVMEAILDDYKRGSRGGDVREEEKPTS